MKISYCTICSRYWKIKRPKISYFLEKTLVLSIICSKCKKEDEKILKEDKSIEILKVLSLINNTEQYQKINNDAWKKHESRI